MRVLVQWATATATDWVAYDIRRIQDVRALPRKPVPSGSPVIDGLPGWVAAINVQGIVFSGFDHIGFSLSGGALRVHAWNDDPEDFPDGTRWGQVWSLLPPAPDPAFGGQMNTRQSVVYYCEPQAAPALAGVPYEPWSAMPIVTNANDVLHGVWTPDALWQALQGARSPRGWREWMA